MFGKIAAFEFKYQIKQPLFYVVAIIFFLLTFGAVTSDNIQIGGGGAFNQNSPYAILQTLAVMSAFGIFVMTAFTSNLILRDFEFKTAEYLYATSIKKLGYILGRFSGAFAAGFIAFSFSALAIALGSLMPWMDPERIGPFVGGHYLYALGVVVFPNLLIAGALFFSIANLTRSLMMTYAGVVLFLVFYVISQTVLNDPEYRTIAAMIDPFGIGAMFEATRYWTLFERNTMVPAIEGVLLYNRLMWVGLSLIVIGLNVALFRFDAATERGGIWRKKKKEKAEQQPATIISGGSISVAPVFDAGTPWRQFITRTGFEVSSVVKSLPFVVLLVLGIFNTVGNMFGRTNLFGTETFPVTRSMISAIEGGFSLFILIVAIYYGAELVWRERQVKVSEVLDAAPAPNWTFAVSKLLALFLVVALLALASIVSALLFQIFSGFTDVEVGVYLERILVGFALPFYMIAVLSMFIQTLVSNKFFGMAIMLVYLISTLVMNNLGFEHNLYQFAGSPFAPLSDLNGQGHFLEARAWFLLYWFFFSLLLFIASYVLWRRGTFADWKQRIRHAGSALTPVAVGSIAVAFAGFIGTGSYIYYNTNIINEYVTQDDLDQWAVDYENTYRQYEGMPQPRIIAVKVDVDIFPYERDYYVDGSYLVENRTDAPIGQVHLVVGQGTDVQEIGIEGGTVSTQDERFNYYIFDLARPMEPGEQRRVTFKTARENSGFKNSRDSTTIVYNGTFFNNTEAMPAVGFQRFGILTDRNKRRKFDLEPVDRLPKLEDEKSHYNSYLRQDSDWVNFEATVSTAADQVAIAPGYLEREWVEGDRRYFHYAMDAPIQNFFAFLSASYARKKDTWNGIEFEVFYHPAHEYNVDRMIEASIKSMDYFSENFSPFQYRQFRILEFPAYATFAQSFPNTIPYSEGIGFIADLTDPSDIDYVFYVTAHEAAHQWWAHQVMGANTQGGTMLVETFAQYSALMVMEKEYGPHLMRRFLKFELDNYLTSRGGEVIEELPLYKVENQQYIHYRKGSVVMYALKDYVGEDVVNRSLARLIDEKAYDYRPYATSLDFLRILREEAGPEHQDLITDLFEKIILFDLKAERAEVEPLADGKYKVTLTYKARKLEADGLGEETERDMDMMIDIGVFTRSPDNEDFGEESVLHFQKHRITNGEGTIELIVDQKPEYAGIDPYNKLIDRDSNDNLRSIDETRVAEAQ